jgi:transposase
MRKAERRERVERRIVEYLRLGKSTNAIAAELKVCKKTVKRIRERAAECGYLEREAELPAYPERLFGEEEWQRGPVSEADALLKRYQSWIEERLESGWHPITVFEELPERPSSATFYRFLHRHKLTEVGRRARVVPEIVHEAGEALLVDWGKLCSVELDGKRRTLWAFVGVLGYSRYRMVRLVWDLDLETTLEVLASMFEELGGIPRKVTSDNPKVFALQASRYEPVLNPEFERFAAHYGFVMECLPPAEPQQKGKVERQIPYIRRLYEPHQETWVSLEESQGYLNRRLVIANDKRHGTTGKRPRELLEIERAALRPLPQTPFEREEIHLGTVRRDGHVRFRGKYYSVEERYIGSEVTIIGTKVQVSIYCNGKLLEVHSRLPHDSVISKSTKLHHRKPWERAMEDDSLYALRARRLGPAVEQMVKVLLRRGDGFIDYRRVWGILSLDKKFSAERINLACEQALSLNKLSYRFVQQLLMLVPPLPFSEEEPPRHSTAKFVHPLEEYRTVINLVTRKKGEPHEHTNH